MSSYLDIDDLEVDDLGIVPSQTVADVAANFPRSTNATIFDIETGPREWSEIERFYEPPAKLPPFDDSMVKYGNTKDAAKKAEKYAQVKADYLIALAGEEAAAEAHRLEWLSKAALSPLTGRVLAIGYSSDGEVACDTGGDGNNEADLLCDFWATCEGAVDDGRLMIGFNCRCFDLPFLIRRSWLLGVDISGCLLVDGRYWSRTFVDLMDVWAMGTRQMVSLDSLAQFFGVGSKPEGVGGADFARLFLDPATREEAIAYLRNDLSMTAAVAKKMGVY